MKCRFVYSYVDMLTGQQFVGCVQKVYNAEVELDAVQQKGGFGGVKMTGDALPHCPSLSSAPTKAGAALRLREPPLLRLQRRRPRGNPGLRHPQVLIDTESVCSPTSDSCKIRRRAGTGVAEAVEELDANEALPAATGRSETEGDGPKFTLELNQDQKDIKEWVHGFAEGVVRPAAEEWDEREETPWPVIQEAAKIGLYSFEALGQFWADATGLTLPIANEELFWGDAGIGMSIMGTSLAVAAIFGQGTPEQMGEWIPQCFGTPDDVKLAPSAPPSPTPVPTSPRSARPPSTTRPRTSGSSTARRPGPPTAASPTSTS